MDVRELVTLLERNGRVVVVGALESGQRYCETLIVPSTSPYDKHINPFSVDRKDYVSQYRVDVGDEINRHEHGFSGERKSNCYEALGRLAARIASGGVVVRPLNLERVQLAIGKFGAKIVLRALAVDVPPADLSTWVRDHLESENLQHARKACVLSGRTSPCSEAQCE